MDPISYGVAAKQKQRIEKVIAEPDSTSGVITVPQVIATGETITVPAGRVAVLPNVQVDGELVVDGEVFIPSGSSYTATSINVGGVGSRITGDFNNAVNAKRTAFQSTNTGGTQINVIPNNTTAGSAMHWYYGSSDIANTSRLRVGITSTNEAWINSEVVGTGIYAPIVMITGGAERMRIDTAGNVGIGTTSNIDKLTVKGNISVGSLIGTTASDGSGVLFFRGADQSQMGYVGFGTAATPFEFVNSKNNGFNFYNGDVLQKTAYGLGYGTGAGGTVTQLTSKSTAVTLNKPTGVITMNNAALAAGATVDFVLSNSLVSVNDIFVVTLGNGTYSPSAYNVWGYASNGACGVFIKNISGASLSEAVPLNFAIIKGAIS